MVLFEGRSIRGGYNTTAGKTVLPNNANADRYPTPKKTKAKSESGAVGQATSLADTLYEFVVHRLPSFKLSHNKRTGKSEKVPLPVSRKRMIRDFTAMIESDEYSVELIELVLNWYVAHPGTWQIRSVTSIWKHFPILLVKCQRGLNPYLSEELSGVVQYLHNRFVVDYDSIESVVGRSRFAVEQVMDAMESAGLERELSYLRNAFGSSLEWVQTHLATAIDSKFDVEHLALTVEKVKRQVRHVLAQYGLDTEWIDSLEVSLECTVKGIRE